MPLNDLGCFNSTSVLVLAVLVALPLTLSRADELTNSADPMFAQQMARYCFQCHGPDNAEADLNFKDVLSADGGLLRRPGLLKTLKQKFADREMPPVVLTATSKPLRTSPVNRGVWVLEQVIGQSLPDPPADVPEISEEATNAEGLTVTEQLALHRQAKMCRSCHVRIDPLGLTLQDFDGIGRWREKDAAGKPIDALGVLEDGTKIAGPAGLKNYLKTNQRDKILDTFCRRLLGYSLGRAVGPGDASLLDKMKTRLAQRDHRFTAVLDAVLESKQFLQRRDEAPTEDL